MKNHDDCEITIFHKGYFVRVRVKAEKPRIGRIIGDDDDGPDLELSAAETEEAMREMDIRPLGMCDEHEQRCRAV